MTASARIAGIDVLRGVCLLGILVMNIQSFAMPHAAYLNPTVFGSLHGADGLAWVVGRVFFDFKFLNLFATLFGASLVLAGDEVRPHRRLVWLVLFGLAHAYLVWYGDVLFTYGVVGLLVLPARRLEPRRLLLLGVSALVLAPLLSAVFGLLWPVLPHAVSEAIARHLDARSVAEELAVYRGGFLSQLSHRARLSFEGQTLGLVFETGWRAAGCMLVGMAAAKVGALAAPRWLEKRIPLAFAGGLTLTLAGLALQVSTGFAARPWLFAQALHELGAVGLSLAMGLSVLGLARRHPTSAPARAFGRLGRVAFTAYLSQSLVGTWVFGGHGRPLRRGRARGPLRSGLRLRGPPAPARCRLACALRRRPFRGALARARARRLVAAPDARRGLAATHSAQGRRRREVPPRGVPRRCSSFQRRSNMIRRVLIALGALVVPRVASTSRRRYASRHASSSNPGCRLVVQLRSGHWSGR